MYILFRNWRQSDFVTDYGGHLLFQICNGPIMFFEDIIPNDLVQSAFENATVKRGYGILDEWRKILVGSHACPTPEGADKPDAECIKEHPYAGKEHILKQAITRIALFAEKAQSMCSNITASLSSTCKVLVISSYILKLIVIWNMRVIEYPDIRSIRVLSSVHYVSIFDANSAKWANSNFIFNHLNHATTFYHKC